MDTSADVEPAPMEINVVTSVTGQRRILHEERNWTAPRLVVLTAVSLVIAIVALYLAASTTIPGYDGQYFPWTGGHALPWPLD